MDHPLQNTNWVKTLLNVSGYGLHTEKNDRTEYNLDLIVPNITPTVSKKNIFKWIYVALVFLTIGWTIIYAIIQTILTGDKVWLYRITFQLLIALQYLIAMSYFNKSDLFTKLNNLPALILPFKKMLVLSACVSVCVAITCLTLVIKGYRVFIYTSIYKETKSTGILFLLFFDELFSYLTFLTNVSGFAINMMYHRDRLIFYNNKMGAFSLSSVSLAQKINSITVEYTYLKEEYGNTVDILNSFFVVLNTLGILHTYFVLNLIDTSTIQFKEFWDIILYFVVEYIYIMSAQKVKRALDSIAGVIQSPTYIDACIRRNTNEKILPNIPVTVTNEILGALSVQSYITTVEQSETIAWLVLKNIVSEEWATFNILGLVTIKESSVLQKIFGAVCAILLSSDIINLLSIND